MCARARARCVRQTACVIIFPATSLAPGCGEHRGAIYEFILFSLPPPLPLPPPPPSPLCRTSLCLSSSGLSYTEITTVIPVREAILSHVHFSRTLPWLLAISALFADAITRRSAPECDVSRRRVITHRKETSPRVEVDFQVDPAPPQRPLNKTPLREDI